MIDYVLAIDPGKREAGWCLMNADGKVHMAGLARVPKDTPFDEAGPLLIAQFPKRLTKSKSIGSFGTCVVEYPMVYPGTRQKGKPEDIVAVAYHAGLFAGARMQHEDRIVKVAPNEWKGTMPKLLHHKRLAQHVENARECVEAVEPPGMRHHVWDAVGLAHWQWKRVNE